MNTLVVIIDMQNGFINHNTDKVSDNILRFINALDKSKTTIVGTRYINHPSTACYRFENWTKCMAGSEESQIVSQLTPHIQQVFDKDKYSCWNSEFKAFVKANCFDKLYFCGVNTGCCVLHSAFDCYNDVVDCSVIMDLCGSTSGVTEHEAALVVLRSCITKQRVITTDQAIEEINNSI